MDQTRSCASRHTMSVSLSQHLSGTVTVTNGSALSVRLDSRSLTQKLL